MSEYTDQRDRIVNRIGTVTDVGKVHNRPRYGDAYQHYVTDVEGVPTLRGWEVGLDEPGVEVIRHSQGWRQRNRWWYIRGYAAMQDETDHASDAIYPVLMDLAEDIADAIDADRTLNGSCLDHDPVQTEEPVPITIGGGVLCWAIGLRFMAWTMIT